MNRISFKSNDKIVHKNHEIYSTGINKWVIRDLEDDSEMDMINCTREDIMRFLNG